MTKTASQMSVAEFCAELRRRNQGQDDNFLLDLANRLEDGSASEPPAGMEDVPFLPIKPEVLQAFSKQMVDWGAVWVEYKPDGARVIPHEEIYARPENRADPISPLDAAARNALARLEEKPPAVETAIGWLRSALNRPSAHD